MTKKALVILAQGVEEIEAIVPIDLMRRASIEVTLAALQPNDTVTGRSGISIEPEVGIDAVLDKTYDAVVLPGGPGTHELCGDARVLEIVRKQAESGQLLGAICAAPLVLKEAGVLRGRQYTSHFTVHDALPDSIDAPIVKDFPIITSPGAGTAIPFALALIEALCDNEKAMNVAKSICYSH